MKSILLDLVQPMQLSRTRHSWRTTTHETAIVHPDVATPLWL